MCGRESMCVMVACVLLSMLLTIVSSQSFCAQSTQATAASVWFSCCDLQVAPVRLSTHTCREALFLHSKPRLTRQIQTWNGTLQHKSSELDCMMVASASTQLGANLDGPNYYSWSRQPRRECQHQKQVPIDARQSCLGELSGAALCQSGMMDTRGDVR